MVKMAEAKVLIKGYTGEENGEEHSCSTVSLVKDKGIVMVVDPGTLKSQELLAEKLKQEGLTVDDVNVVCLTHSHIDHYRNVGMFPNAKVLEYFGLWNGDKVEDWKSQFSENIQIIKTPGHNYDCITLLVKTGKGIVAICGDVFWKENFPKNDVFASNKKELEKSRKKVLEIANWIIPGHGEMYKVKK